MKKFRVTLDRWVRQETVVIIKALNPTAAVSNALTLEKGGGLAWDTRGVVRQPAPARGVVLAEGFQEVDT